MKKVHTLAVLSLLVLGRDAIAAKRAPVRDAAEYFDTLPQRFVPESARGLHAVFQFVLTEPDLTFFASVDDGKLKLEKGRAEKPNVTITAGSDDYVKVANGEADGAHEVIKRKMKVDGDLKLARRMKQIFPAGPVARAEPPPQRSAKSSKARSPRLPKRTTH